MKQSIHGFKIQTMKNFILGIKKKKIQKPELLAEVNTNKFLVSTERDIYKSLAE